MTTTTTTTRYDGWTHERRVRFLDHLAGHGNVRAACAAVGMSREAAYRLRRREPLFARGWAAALVNAREAAGEQLAAHAMDGFEEEVWYRGELVGTRRKYDVRLMLAHMARLDRVAEDEEAQEDAERFEELLAANGGIEPLAKGDAAAGELPPGREDYAEQAQQQAEREMTERMPESYPAADAEGGMTRAQYDALQDECIMVWRRAPGQARRRWDAWYADACERIDAMLAAGNSSACTLSDVSTCAVSDAGQGACAEMGAR